jgi:oligopeptide transport system ATP-binding protein
MSVLTIRDLSVRFDTAEGSVRAVDHFNLTVGKGECIGIVGESGSGKSQTFLAAMGLLAGNGRATGSVMLEGQEILNAPRRVLNRVRGNRISMIFQDPMSALTPFLRIGRQMSEGLIRHRGLSTAEARQRVLETLELVRISDPKRRFNQYPHELSGGMRQRVMIAQAILCKPLLLVADEPTTALDVTVQAQILEILDGLKQHTDTSIVIITHDLGVVAGLCDRVLVMYGGRVVEYGSLDDVFYRPAHPYTRGLLHSIPTLDLDPDTDLPVIPGQPPNIQALPPGCAFAPRCGFVVDRCRADTPTLGPRGEGHYGACHIGLHP